ncbi:MAG: response regulator transcription factor [Tannerellaceae bacterium]|jgi:DNA-binding response OmpR family regulator|nr:response regulator transcription factor [Tannerellaceae bacterium]
MKILLVEDEINIASFIERGLKEYDHEVTVAHDGAEGWEVIKNESFHLLILDIIMPRMNGIELCLKYRSVYGFGSIVILLTALGTTGDIVKGLEAGADDYLVKPFSFAELKARIGALSRRLKAGSGNPVLTCGDLVLDKETHHAIRKGVSIDLTVREYGLLEYLMLNQGTTLTRQNIIKEVWEKDADRNMNVVDVYVNYLRTKIDRAFVKKLIHTVSGVGYRMEA